MGRPRWSVAESGAGDERPIPTSGVVGELGPAGDEVPRKLAERRDRVHRMMRLTLDLGDEARNISEIDVSDRDNLKVTAPRDGHIVTLLLGDRQFAQRYTNFLNHYSEIKRRLPNAATLDLRLDDRITVVE